MHFLLEAGECCQDKGQAERCYKPTISRANLQNTEPVREKLVRGNNAR